MKVSCRFVLALAALLPSFPMVAQTADHPPQRGMGLASPFLSACQGSKTASADLNLPDPFQAAGCQAQQTCPTTQCVISCMGLITCTVGSTTVTCDGATTSCPYQSCWPPPIAGCADPCAYCECRSHCPSGPCGCAITYC